jgi:outer membrane scaffolding protein for murein synthesis (MipA/OmpV family)
VGCALTRYILFLLALSGASKTVLAQEVDMTRSGQPVYIESVPVDDERRKDAWVGQLGLGLIMSPDFLGGGAHEFNLRADVRVTYKDTFFVENNKFGAVLTSRRFLRAGVIGRIQGGRRDDLIRGGLSEADDIDDTFELGVFAGTSLYKLFLSAEAYWGVSGGHSGMTAELEAGYLFELNSEFKLVPLLGVSIGSRDYMQAYFGVPAGHTQYAPYNPGGGIYDVHAELSLEQRLAKNWLLKGSVRLSKLKDNAFGSPFAREDRVQARAFAGVVWLF